MPKCCFDCPFHDREFYGCQAFDFKGTKEFDDMEDFWADKERYKNCPLLLIKDHD